MKKIKLLHLIGKIAEHSLKSKNRSKGSKRDIWSEVMQEL